MNFFKDEDLEKLDDRVKEETKDIIRRHLNNLLNVINYCESPIEQLFGIKLHEVIHDWGLSISPGIFANQQEIIEIGSKKYRPDFILYVGEFVYELNECSKFVIECDGHEFHEKSKKQVARDKRRDRDLTAAGFHIIHFTGSEIWKDPSKCALEAISIATRIHNQKDLGHHQKVREFRFFG